MLCAVLRDGTEFDPEDIIAHLASRLPRYMVPRYIQLMQDLPKTPGTLRVKKAMLREQGIKPSTWDRGAQSGSTSGRS